MIENTEVEPPISDGASASDKPDTPLERKARLLDVALSHIVDFAYVFDLEGRFAYVNAALLRLWGLELAEAVGKNFFDLGYPDELALRLQNQIQTVIDTGLPLKDETPFTSTAGTGYYEYIFTPVIDAGGKIEAVAGSTRDITDRRRIDEQRALAVRESSVLAERNRMAQELHDTLAQGLTGIAMQLDAAAYAMQQDPLDAERVIRHITRGREVALQCLVDARSSISSLRAPVTDGLPAALERLVNDPPSGVRAELTVEGAPFDLPELVENDLFRIGQEALTNCLRHSGAGNVRLSLAYLPGGVRLSILDDGRGFDLNVAQGGFGVIGMHDRARRLGSELSIDSLPGRGTEVAVEYKSVSFELGASTKT